MLTVRELTVRYGEAIAVDGVDLEVPDGTVVCVLGPSGSGKSTLLRAIAGLEPAARGTIAWDDADLAHTPPHRRRFGLMFQDHALFPHRDVLGNVAFGLRMQRLDRATVDARARAALERVGLAGFEHRRVRELSGGEQQRVALARALAPEPRLLMLDEPLGSLDRALREHLVTELRELFTALGVTVLFVTHDQDEAFALADRVAIMRDGRIEQVGAPEAVWQRPATEFAARFLGFANVVDATVGTHRVTSPWGPMPRPDGAAQGPARLAARPDGFGLDPDGVVRGTVTSATFRRDHFLVRIETTDGPLEVAVADPPAIGGELRLTLEPRAAVVLPA